ncbi:Methyltransferase-like protein 7A [Armadillidium nasatum]|uniref:Methyltransferase-like protein 7A n=1 Tax=Armadillidium nasatum TaxID=96803 RepID=A0A5N5TEM9_9CRUS|nr:Methyltransferase-like protein 7A [Armadillidium nasatum]
MAYFFYILTFFIVLYIIFKVFSQRLFAFFMGYFSDSNPKFFGTAKRELFKGIEASVKNNKLTLLEVGVGTGTNFEYYPNGTHLIVIDPNPHFKKYYDENRKKFSNIKSEEIIVTTGEEMDGIKANSVDVVVLSHVLCSVNDISKVLYHCHRVLVPGGKLFYFEHILEFDDAHWLRRILQEFLSVTGIWPLLFAGCYLNREVLREIQAAGFSKVNGKKKHIKIDSKIFSIISSHLVGTATK